MKIGVYPGSFDPLTNGHLDIIKRASKLVDKLIVGIFINTNKNSTFSIDERMDFIKICTQDIDNIEIIQFSGLLVDFMTQKNASIVFRGLRAVTDFEYEFQIALANKKLNKDIETIFLMANSEHSFISSSVVREIAKFGGNIEGFVPNSIKSDILRKFDITS